MGFHAVDADRIVSRAGALLETAWLIRPLRPRRSLLIILAVTSPKTFTKIIAEPANNVGHHPGLRALDEELIVSFQAVHFHLLDVLKPDIQTSPENTILA